MLSKIEKTNILNLKEIFIDAYFEENLIDKLLDVIFLAYKELENEQKIKQFSKKEKEDYEKMLSDLRYAMEINIREKGPLWLRMIIQEQDTLGRKH